MLKLYDGSPYNDAALEQILTQVDHILISVRLGYADLISFCTVYEKLLTTKSIGKALLLFSAFRRPLTLEAKEVIRCFKGNYPNTKIAKASIFLLESYRKIFRFNLDSKALVQITSLLAELRINVVH